MSLQTPDVASLCGDPRNSSRRYRGRGTAKRGDYHDSMSHTAVNLTVLSCAKVRNYYRRDGTAKRGNSHDSRLQAGPVPPSAGPLYL